MVITKDYQILKRGSLHYVISNEVPVCPICRGRLFLIGSRRRQMILSNQEKISLVIKRYRCKSCGKIHHELPMCCIPYKRYEAKVIQDMIEEGSKDKKAKENTMTAYPCEKSTQIRTMFWYERFLLWLKVLLEQSKIYHHSFSIKEILTRLVKSSVLSNRKYHRKHMLYKVVFKKFYLKLDKN